MIKTLASLTLGLSIAIGTVTLPVLSAPLQLVSSEQIDVAADSLGLDDQLWGRDGEPGDKRSLITSIDHSITFLQTPRAAQVYRNYPVRGITRDRVERSLVRFRQLVLAADSPAQLRESVKQEFVFYKSVGKDGRGSVFFTGYYEPIYQASRVATPEFRYPLYRQPPNMESWRKPHPTRIQLEGRDGLSGNGLLRGLELVWLRDRLEAFLVQIQGSAQLQLTDGTTMTVGYDGGTDYPYTSVGRQIAGDGKLPLDGLTLPVLIDFFRRNPFELSNYIPRNNRFIFFRETHGAPAMGSIQVPVTAERSIATDKSLMPPGALALIHTRVPFPTAVKGKMEQRLVSRYVLDQDTGSAIRGAGRVDYYMGTGEVAGDRAGVIGWTGQLYYLLLKE
ncbi:murein transglycosylase A [Microseira wollei]|uniref:peptidoglycan lytic exotransglycosylase n=1 Tax=Microseira wollei NIES-4236 TaxID=2530354 RepID=A0AAV3XML8_9CYAN|nr:MltA domain-containing protein [Microseira wollei]GET42921.1 MltA domain protein [Microseira wollei NIES-4236]